MEEIIRKQRYFVDERSGCIAVRDRTLTDPEYSGLHSDTTGVVGYWHGTYTSENCPTCGHLQSKGFTISEVFIQEAYALCDSLNEADTEENG